VNPPKNRLVAMKIVSVLRAVVSLSFLAGCLIAADQKPLPEAIKDLDPKEIKLGEDEPGCQDSSLLARFAGCNIIQCGKKEADSLDLQVGATPEGAAQSETADGASEKIYYLCPGKLVPASIVKLAEAALVKTGGYKLVYTGKDNDEFPIITVSKDDQWIQVSTYTYQNYSAYILTAIKIASEPPVTADGMVDELKTAGKFLLTGITFKDETNELNGDSEKMLAELANALAKQPEVKVKIDVHTDNLEGPKTSQEITQKRAEVVGVWLEKHGVAKERIIAQGSGSADPVGSNENDDGRAKNRRIEVVKL
jgi:OOP family OmpA-OmpF porin